MTAIGTSVQATQAVISLRAYMNPQGPTQQALINSETPDAFTAATSAALTLTVATSTTTAFNLATLFAAYTAPVFVSITDISSPGLGFTITTSDDASGNMGVAPNFWFAWMADGSTALPTVHITNPSSTQKLYVQVGVMST